ncbi:MAG: sulfite exporter TauE/SafE family protein [Ignavibacteriae bacterium]|nr:sulfite exporter TauE/SafE family protein [Ignavibacteriota bacterium]
MTLWELLLLFVVGVASGFLNVMAGGGSALTMPLLIFLGQTSAEANGTLRVAIIIQNISSVSSFRRLGVHEFKRSLAYTAWAMPGAIAGAVAGVTVADETFQKILGGVMIASIFSLFMKNPAEDTLSKQPKRSWLIYPVMLVIGFYGGFIQISVGFLFMIALFHIEKLNLIYVNMHKVTVVLMYMVPVVAVYAWTGNVDWVLGLLLGVGSAVGGWWAAHASIKKGEKLIRAVLVVAIIIMAAKLFGVY